MSAPAIGVIGGSGLYELEGLTDVRWRRVRTPFGDPSDEFCTGTFEGRPVIFLPRHGRGHRLTPSELNFRANVWGLKSLGAEWVISISAVGSMKETIHPLDLVIPSQFYDATKRRVGTFFGEGIVAHVGMADPVCPALADALEKAARATGASVHRGGTYICIEGPQFSTKAESQIYRGWGVDVIGMTNMPEATPGHSRGGHAADVPLPGAAPQRRHHPAVGVPAGHPPPARPAARQVLPAGRQEDEEVAAWLSSTSLASATRWSTCSARRATRSSTPRG